MYRRKASKDAREVPEERDEKSDRPETPRAVPHGHVESRLFGREQFGTVFSLRENDDVVGCGALVRNLPQTRGDRDGGVPNFLPQDISLENVMEVGDVQPS